MLFPHRLKSQLNLVSRVSMWAVISLLAMVGIFSTAPAWGAPTACPDNGSGNSTIPIIPQSLFLRFAGPASTYQVSLCEEPSAAVNIATQLSQAGKITVSPASFSLTSTVPQTVSVSIANGHPATEPFSVVITHSSTSTDPDFNHGALNVPVVTAYYSPPVAVSDIANTLHGQSIAINVKSNDVDRIGQGIVVPSGATFNPTNGTATLNADNTIQYTPDVGFSGVATFTYPIEDSIGNRATGKVFVHVASQNVANSQLKQVSVTESSTVEFDSKHGKVNVVVPSLIGVPANSIVKIVFGEIEEPSGDIRDSHLDVSAFTGTALKIEMFVDGVLVHPTQLSAPLKLSFVLPDSFVEEHGNARITLLAWNGTAWVTEGVVVEWNETQLQIANLASVPNATTLVINTTVFGEFVLVKQHVIHMPSLSRR